MNAYIITLLGSLQSLKSQSKLRDSHRKVGNDFELQNWAATTPEQVDGLLSEHDLVWTYPWAGDPPNEHEERRGLTLHPYATTNEDARIACFLSHYRLWQHVVRQGRWIMVFEDDALFTRKLEPETLDIESWGAIGLCDPRGATRKAMAFFEGARCSAHSDIIETPWVDDDRTVPQGLAGHSAYMIGPALAQALIDEAADIGCWPNDALMCKQLFPRQLGITTKFYTTIQHTPSTLA